MKYVILSTLIMAICVLSVNYWLRGDLLRILVGSSFGVISFLLSAYLFKIEELNEVKKMASQLISKIKSRN
jgi:hypothetical protein